ncbi:MAG: FG-GAP-like repeat-containing protein, partial [Pirellulales bacterium]
MGRRRRVRRLQGRVAERTAAGGNRPAFDRPLCLEQLEARRLLAVGGTGLFVDSGQQFGREPGTAVALGDVDSDGDLDALVTNEDRGNQVWLNAGSGQWIESQILGNSASTDVALGDLDGDGDLDAVVANRVFSDRDAANRVWINDGFGRFVGDGRLLGDRGSQGVALGDLDSDGDLDVLLADSDGLRVWRNDGSANFVAPPSPLGSSGIQDVALADLDGDGDLDAFTVHSYSNQSNRVWLNDGAGNLTDSGQTFSNAHSFGVALGDIDGDGDTDAVVAGRGNAAGNRVWINNGHAQFSDSGPFEGSSAGSGVVLGDVDADGDLDAIFAMRNDSRSMWINDSTGSFRRSPFGITNGEARDVAVGDLDGDGDLDAFFVVWFASDRVWLNADAELAIQISPTTAAVASGTTETVGFTLTVTNLSPQPVLGAGVTSTFAAELADVTLTNVVASAGASSEQSPGPMIGQLIDLVDLPAGGTITYTIMADVTTPVGFVGSLLVQQASVTAPDGRLEFNSTNNDAGARITVGAGVAEGGTGRFVANQILPNTGKSRDVALGDLNGDGFVDAFVLADGSAVALKSVNRVLLNDGTGQLTDTGQTTGSRFGLSGRVALGDLDGDGDLDAFVTYSDQGGKIWWNDGRARFSDSAQSLAGPRLEGYRTRNVALADLDGDGDLDAMVLLADGGNRVWLNDGFGRFSDSGQSLGDQASFGVALGDVDGDGDIDALVGNRGQSNRVWLNDGQARFSEGQTLPGGFTSLDVALGDVDGDGDLDAVVANRFSPNTLWLNDGLGSFTEAVAPASDRETVRVTLGDVDGDGDLDALFAEDEMVSDIWFNDGSGTFDVSAMPLPERIRAAVELGDLDGDGDLDVVAAGITNGQTFESVGIWINADTDLAIQIEPTATGVFPGDSATVSYALVVRNMSSQRVEGVDVTDQLRDILAGVELTGIASTGGATSSLSPGPIVGTFNDTVTLPGQATITYRIEATLSVPPEAERSLVTQEATVTVPSGLVDANLANNRASSRNEIEQPITLSTGRFLPSDQVFSLSPSQAVAMGDFDGDGFVDAVVANGGAGNQILLNDGRGNLVDSGQSLGDQQTLAVAVGDLDGDGDLDVVAANGNRQPERIWLNDGSGLFFDSGRRLGKEVSDDVALADLDDDGDLDIVFAGFSGAQIWLNDGSGAFMLSPSGVARQTSQAVAVEDADGDGDLDLFFASTSSSGPNGLWLNDGSGQFVEDTQNNAFQQSVDVGFGDVNGDGNPDLLLLASNSQFQTWLGDGTGRFELGQQLFAQGQAHALAVGDVDGDGDLDVAVANDTSNPIRPPSNRLLLNDGTGQFEVSVLTLGRGNSFDIALEDLDFDGDLDLFVVNRTEEPNRIFFNADTDLVIQSTPTVFEVVPGARQSVSYQLSATNLGPRPVAGALVEDLFESSLTNVVLQQVDTPDGATSTLSLGGLTGDLFDT